METPLTPLEFARRARRLYADREAVVDGVHRFTYRQFFDRCDRWSSALQGFGVRAGERVAYISPNSHAHLECYYAVPQIGAVTVPINFRLSAEDFAYIIQHSGARVVCAHSSYAPMLEAIRPRLSSVTHFVVLDGGREGWLSYEACVAAATPGFDPPPITETDLLSINYTSGTTARPKGVMITHRNAYLNSLSRLVHNPMTCADRYLWTLPMFHANGWDCVWIVTAVGAAHICLPRPEPRAVFEMITRESITTLCAAPTVLIALANAPEEIRRAVPRGVQVHTAGAPPAAATIERIEGELGWKITHLYGLTEVSPVVTMSEPRPEHACLDRRAAAIVKARQGVECVGAGEVRVVDLTGQEVPRDGRTVGEIVMRGNAVMAGYYQDPEATAHAIRDGWFHSGDAAVVHPDGFIEIRDRWKDIIISGGENISSIEVEATLLRHPAVQEAAVVGVPDEKWGEAVRACIVVKPGGAVTASELRHFLRGELAHFKVPREFHFMEELPKTATGKIQKYVLRGGRANLSPQ